MRLNEIVEAVKAERDRQDAKFGRAFYGRSDAFWLAILAEEFGEVARAILETTTAVELADRKRQEEHTAEELIQVAAVCFSWLEFRTPAADQLDFSDMCADPPGDAAAAV